MHSNSIKEQIRNLRKKGTSIITLAKKFKIAKSTISLWVRDIELPEELRKYLTDNSINGREKGLRIMKVKREIAQRKYEEEAQNILATINFKNKNLARLMAAIIFWCEGGKRNLSSLYFTNSDPALMKLFLSCIRSGFEINEKKFRAIVHLHGYHDESKQLKFWSIATKIPLTQFNKSFHKKNTAIRKRENYQGCLSLRYHDSKVARKLDTIYHSLAQRPFV